MTFGARLRIAVTNAGRSVSVENTSDTGPTMRVQLNRSTDATSDGATVTVYGLREGYLSPLLVDGATCSISAGLGRLAGIATGRVVPGSYVDAVEGADRVCTFDLLDGRFQLRDVTVSNSWRQTNTTEIWAYLLGRSGVATGVNRPGRVVDQPTGYVMCRGWRREAERLARLTRSNVSVQSGVVNVWPAGETLQARRLVLSPATIVGQPAQVDEGRLQVTTVYTGTPCNPGDTWRMQAGRFAGVWRSEATSWDLATDGNWVMTMTGVRT